MVDERKERIRTHPGKILERELKAREISANAFALALRVPANRITAILKGERKISPETALRLAQYFGEGQDARFWLTLQANHDLSLERAAKGARIASEVIPAST